MSTPAVIRAIVGLGNPGTGHARTRHNAGFWFADRLVEAYGGTFRKEARLHGHLAEIAVSNAPLLVLKPATYMNKSGQAVQALMAFYKFEPGQILIAHDDLDLAPGVVRLKVSGGHGGHNGLRDLHANIGPDYRRLRIGIGHPGNKDEVLDYVLHKPGKEDDKLIHEAVEAAADAVPLLIEKGWDHATQLLHSRDKNLPAAPAESSGE